MFNTYNCTPNVATKITACSGGIYKTFRESWFENIDLESQRAKDLFDANCGDCHWGGYYGRERVLDRRLVVIQMIICGDKQVIAEIIREEDYNKYFEKHIEENENELGN